MPYKIDDKEFIALVERGIPIERLERRLRPELGLSDTTSEYEEHDGFKGYSEAGFLGISESLLRCIHADWETVSTFGTSHAAIAEAVKKVISGNYQLHPEFEYMRAFFMTAGTQSCPWGCTACGNSAGVIVRKGISEEERREAELSCLGGLGRVAGVVKDLAQERGEADCTVQWFRKIQENAQGERKPFYAPLTGLLPHLIKEHYFFEGKESPYRADPAFLLSALRLTGG